MRLGESVRPARNVRVHGYAHEVGVVSLWLTDKELFDLTGKKQRKLQIEVLSQLRPPVKFRVRPEDSFPLVDRWQFMEPENRRKAG